jgi:hypothetical protein
VLVSAVGLLGSLFLTWSHQLPRGLLAVAGNSPVLRGVPRDPSAWQVYSVTDVLLALVAASLLAVALAAGSGWVRGSVLVAVLLALAFTLHALSVPPSNGVLLINQAAPGQYLLRAPSAGVGETVAIASLGLAIVGLGLPVVGLGLSKVRD